MIVFERTNISNGIEEYKIELQKYVLLYVEDIRDGLFSKYKISQLLINDYDVTDFHKTPCWLERGDVITIIVDNNYKVSGTGLTKLGQNQFSQYYDEYKFVVPETAGEEVTIVVSK